MMKITEFGMNCKEITIFRALPYQPKKKASLSAYGGQRHKRHLQEYKKVSYINMLTNGKLNSYLADIDKQAQERIERHIEGLKQAQGITEQLKAENTSEWVGRMNNIRACVVEIVNEEIIYA